MRGDFLQKRGYTLTEVMVAVALSVLIAAGAFSLFSAMFSYWKGVNYRVQADSDINMTMSRLVYGMPEAPGLRNVVGDTASLTTMANNSGWTLNYSTPASDDTFEQRSLVWSRADKTLTFNPGAVVVGQDIVEATASIDRNLFLITLRLERSEGRYTVRRELETEILFRNF